MAGQGMSRSRRQLRQEINLVPFIDVLLVLLVIFIVAAPLLTHAVKINLPKAASHPAPSDRDDVALGIRADGSLLWNGTPVDTAALFEHLKAEARRDPQPGLRIHADAKTPYEVVARAMAAAARAGLVKIAFVSDPRLAHTP